VISEHATAALTFAEIDRLAGQMQRTGAPTEVGLTIRGRDGAGPFLASFTLLVYFDGESHDRGCGGARVTCVMRTFDTL
jgi:hypothetical protein